MATRNFGNFPWKSHNNRVRSEAANLPRHSLSLTETGKTILHIAKSKKMDEIKPAPLRSLDDFILQSARFQLPNLQDPERWANRVISNLQYYQSNYFILAIIIFLIVGIYHPVSMLIGFAALGSAYAGFVYISNNQAQLRRLKRRHPGVSVCIVLVAGYLIIHILGSVMVFLFGIALPLLFILMHASLRLRSIKNKLANKVEYVGICRTPMGLFLESLGMEEQAGS